MSPDRGRKWITWREAVLEGAPVGTFSYPDRSTVHAYVEDSPGWPYMACGIHGLHMWRKHYPHTMDTHPVSAVSCGRCRLVLGDALEAKLEAKPA